jgi:hypothetical protein
MILEDIKNIKTGKKDIRNFGLALGTVLCLIGLLVLYKGRGYYPWLLAFSAAAYLLALILPIVLKPIYLLLSSIGVVIGWFMTRLILIMLFYLIITPIALFFKISGKDLLKMKTDKNAASYWIPRSAEKHDKSSYEKQY